MKNHRQGNPGRTIASSSNFWGWIKHHTLFWGIASLIWLLIKSGRKPSRLQYPCQKAAAANVSLFLLPFLLPLIHKTHRYLKTCSRPQVIRFLFAVTLCIGTIFTGNHLWVKYQQARQIKYYKQLGSGGPFGKKIAGASGMAAGFMSIPHAMAMPSHHRVVSVHHSGATDLDFSDTSSTYYGDDAHVDQAVVDQMVSRGMQELTDTDTVEATWGVILPHYQPGEIVAIKVNFNCAGGWGDSDDYVDALPQVVNSVIAGLKTRGVAEGDIRVFDSTRPIPDRFRALIDYPGIEYYGRYGNGDDVKRSTFDSELASAHVDFSASEYPSTTHKISDVLVESDYLINMPIMKRHGGAGITLSAKNHFGSIDLAGFDHDYIYLTRSRYAANRNPIVDINTNTHIKDKTVLIVGDALYAGWRSNNTPPQPWSSFGGDSPNMLFFAVDPVAVDSVMFDYLDREGYVVPASEDILIVAANAGLGIHERWHDNDDRTYDTIDYVEIDLDDQLAPTVPSGLSASAVSSGQIDLGWAASTDDDTAVDEYVIYRDGTRIGTTTVTTYSDMGLSPSTQYTYRVSAVDTVDNESAQSAPAMATTLEGTPDPGSEVSSGEDGGGCFITRSAVIGF